MKILTVINMRLTHSHLLCDVFRNMGALYWLLLHITCSYIIVWSWWDVQISKDKLASYLATTTEQDRGAGMSASEYLPNSFNYNNKASTPALWPFLFVVLDFFFLLFLFSYINFFFFLLVWKMILKSDAHLNGFLCLLACLLCTEPSRPTEQPM